MVMRYFCFYSESLESEVGRYYCEVSEEGAVTRQMDVFGSTIYWAYPGHQWSEDYPFTDQPEFEESGHDGVEIDRELFDTIWAQGQQQRPIVKSI